MYRFKDGSLKGELFGNGGGGVSCWIRKNLGRQEKYSPENVIRIACERLLDTVLLDQKTHGGFGGYGDGGDWAWNDEQFYQLGRLLWRAWKEQE